MSSAGGSSGQPASFFANHSSMRARKTSASSQGCPSWSRAVYRRRCPRLSRCHDIWPGTSVRTRGGVYGNPSSTSTVTRLSVRTVSLRAPSDLSLVSRKPRRTRSLMNVSRRKATWSSQSSTSASTGWSASSSSAKAQRSRGRLTVTGGAVAAGLLVAVLVVAVRHREHVLEVVVRTQDGLDQQRGLSGLVLVHVDGRPSVRGGRLELVGGRRKVGVVVEHHDLAGHRRVGD